MKYLLFFALLITTSLHASRFEDIEDTLDQIQLNLMQKQLFDLIDKQNREQIEYERRNKPKPQVSEFISSRSFIKKYDKRISRNDGAISAIRVDSIKKISDDLVMFSSVNEWNNPQFNEDSKKPYYGMLTVIVLGCKTKTEAMMANIFYDLQLSVTEQYDWPVHARRIPDRRLNGNSIMAQQFHYICDGILKN